MPPTLAASNYEIDFVGAKVEAIKQIDSERPDVVLLDLGLADGDGEEVIRQVRRWSNLPIIVLSAHNREVDKIEALDIGADDFVNKPFSVGELTAALRHQML